jgi:alkanesulfonate monooxygenase SsuD/methylene tetrahydromethanopterin reductase-like flavin-dependent oxidoreductase (luciferase family)
MIEVGVNLPTDVPGASGALLLEWARRADAGPFRSIGVTERLAWSTHDPFAMLAAAAAVTSRVRLMTIIAVAPLRAGALLAKAAATVDSLSGGRLVLGLGIGPRRDDYQLAGVDWSSRSQRFAAILAELRAIWSEDGAIGPRPARPEGPEILVGGASDRAFARMARHADGWVHGGGPARVFARHAARARAAWLDAGRPGRPRLRAQAYFALGGDAATQAGARQMRSYYAFLGPVADKLAESLLTTPQSIVRHLREYQEAGCDELLFSAAVADIGQLERLADVVGPLASRPAKEPAA